MKKLLAFADKQADLDAWRRRHRFDPRQIRRVLGWQHIAGETPKSAALLYLSYRIPEEAEPYVRIYDYQGMRRFYSDDAAAAWIWLVSP